MASPVVLAPDRSRIGGTATLAARLAPCSASTAQGIGGKVCGAQASAWPAMHFCAARICWRSASVRMCCGSCTRSVSPCHGELTAGRGQGQEQVKGGHQTPPYRQVVLQAPAGRCARTAPGASQYPSHKIWRIVAHPGRSLLRRSSMVQRFAGRHPRTADSTSRQRG